MKEKAASQEPHTEGHVSDGPVRDLAVSPGVPLFVDLDGTLLRTDLFLEYALVFARQRLWHIFVLLYWCLHGMSYAKAKVRAHVELNPTDLPYNQELLSVLKTERKRGRRLVIATAADEAWAGLISEHLGIFDGYMGSRSGMNMKGPRKLHHIQAAAGGDFLYAGDAHADGPIWDAARGVITVQAPQTHVRRAQEAGKLLLDLPRKVPLFVALLRTMRPHHYAKNLLLFLPLLAAHQYEDMTLAGAGVLGFIAFSLCASGGYALNDLLDLAADRLHPGKSRRPLAAGELPLWAGLLAAVFLPATAFLFAWLLLPAAFAAVLAFYFVLALLYSLVLKALFAVDIAALCLLYILRIMAGVAAYNMVISDWMWLFSAFLFLSLAALKRYVELLRSPPVTGTLPGRAYASRHTAPLGRFGAVSMACAAMIMGFYGLSAEVRARYASPDLLWLLVAVVGLWGFHMWRQAKRGLMQDDPIAFTMRDPVSIGLGLVGVAAMIAAHHIAL